MFISTTDLMYISTVIWYICCINYKLW